MKARIEIEKCDKCGTCISVCAADALIIINSLEIDIKKCTGCGSCIKVCPFGALSADTAA